MARLDRIFGLPAFLAAVGDGGRVLPITASNWRFLVMKKSPLSAIRAVSAWRGSDPCKGGQARSSLNKLGAKLSHARNHVARAYLDGRIDRRRGGAMLMELPTAGARAR